MSGGQITLRIVTLLTAAIALVGMWVELEKIATSAYTQGGNSHAAELTSTFTPMLIAAVVATGVVLVAVAAIGYWQGKQNEETQQRQGRLQ